MNEFLDLETAFLIPDETERTFAIAVLSAFPDFRIVHEPTVSSKSGRMKRKARPDFELINSQGERLFIEVTSNDGINTSRKKRQRKTVRLAGLGEIYVGLCGDDIDELKNLLDADIKGKVARALRGKFNGNLFSLK